LASEIRTCNEFPDKTGAISNWFKKYHSFDALNMILIYEA